MFGVHPNYNKFTRRARVIEMPIPKQVTIPLTQHIGAPNQAVIKVGDLVKKGQVIGKNDAFVSAYVHASISGKVKEISDKFTPLGMKAKCVTIESDMKDEWIESEQSVQKVSRLKELGLVGLGGATFPTHVKLTPPDGKIIEKIILNGAECEPYLTCDNRLMIENSEELMNGLKTVMELTGCKEAIIGIESNKPNSIRILTKLAKKMMGVSVVALPQIYPQGAEKVLIHSLIGKWVPPGGLPLDVGVVVLNVSTVKAINDALNRGKPLIERIVTVTGDVHEPKNLLVRLGTPLKDLIEFCGGYHGEPVKIIAGGPMMGMAQFTDEVPTMKGTSGVLVFNSIKEHVENPCTKCAKCIDVCPMNLTPNLLGQNSKAGNYDTCKILNVNDCFECGCCAFTCPSKIPLVQLIKDAKYKLRSRK